MNIVSSTLLEEETVIVGVISDALVSHVKRLYSIFSLCFFILLQG
jgi:hypothetical protein